MHQKMSSGLKFRIKEVEELYCLCSEKKTLISFAVTTKLIFAYVLPYAKSRFIHAAQLSINLLANFYYTAVALNAHK